MTSQPKALSDLCALCGNTRAWHKNPGASGVHKFKEAGMTGTGPHEDGCSGEHGLSSECRPRLQPPVTQPQALPSDEERQAPLRAWLAKNIDGDYATAVDSISLEVIASLHDLIAQVRAEAEKEKAERDASIATGSTRPGDTRLRSWLDEEACGASLPDDPVEAVLLIADERAKQHERTLRRVEALEAEARVLRERAERFRDMAEMVREAFANRGEAAMVAFGSNAIGHMARAALRAQATEKAVKE